MGKHKRKRREVIDELSDRIRELEKRIHKRNHCNTDDEYETRSNRTRSWSQSTYRRSRSPHERVRSSTRQSRTPRRRRLVSSSSTSTIQTENKGETEVEESGRTSVIKAVSTEAPAMEQQVLADAPAMEQQDLSLPASIEILLGEDGVPAASNSINFHESLVRRWAAILQNGLSPEMKAAIIKKNSTPLNCSLLIPPKLNEEVAAAMNESGVKRDKRIGEQQVVLSAAIATIGTVLNHMIQTNDEKHIEALSDSSRLLCDLFHENSITRRALILPGLNKDMKELMEQTPISEYLFGDKLQDKVNAIKAVKKSGQELKNTPPQNKAPPQLRGNFGSKNLNYRGPQRPQMPRPSGPKVKSKRPAYPVAKAGTRTRRTPPRQHYQRRRQDHQRR